jgi:hypothetical protein
MPYKIIYFIVLLLVSIASNAQISISEKKLTEKAIRECESALHKTLEVRNWLIKKPPTFLSSAKSRQSLANIPYYRKAFDTAYDQFSSFTSYKVELRTEQDDTSLRSKRSFFSKKCSEFSLVIMNFSSWCLGGKTKDSEAKLFETWLSLAKCGKVKCS